MVLVWRVVVMVVVVTGSWPGVLSRVLATEASHSTPTDAGQLTI